MDAKKTAQQVLEQVGGAENVAFLTHCVTRLRFNLRSMDGVDDAKVKAVPGVVGVVNKGGQYQVIIGASGAPQPFMRWEQLRDILQPHTVLIIDPKVSMAYADEFLARFRDEWAVTSASRNSSGRGPALRISPPRHVDTE